MHTHTHTKKEVGFTIYLEACLRKKALQFLVSKHFGTTNKISVLILDVSHGSVRMRVLATLRSFQVSATNYRPGQTPRLIPPHPGRSGRVPGKCTCREMLQVREVGDTQCSQTCGRMIAASSRSIGSAAGTARFSRDSAP